MKKNLTAEILGVFSTNFSVIVLTLLTGIITSRVLGPEGRGVVTSIMVIPQMVRNLCEMGFRQSTMYYIGRGIFDEKRYIRSIFGLYLLTTSASIAITLGIYCLLNNPNYTVGNMTLALLTLPINLLLTYSGGVFLGKDLIVKYNRQRWVPAVLGMVGVVIFVWAMKLGVWGALLSLVLSNLGILFFNVRDIIKEYGWIWPVFDRRIMMAIIKLGSVYAVSLFIMQMNYRVNIILLERLSTAEQIGFFSLGAGIAELLWQLPTALSVVIISKTATTQVQDQGRLGENVLTLLRLTLLAGGVLAVVLFFAVPFLLPVIYGQAFSPSIKVVQTILPGVVIMVVFKVINSRLAGLGKPYYALYVFGPTLILNIVLDIFLIPKYHAVGAAMASNLCWTISTLVFVRVYASQMTVSLKEMFFLKKSDFNFMKRFRFAGK
ncbi:MAG: polysaccharide biosynthesis C-terminal domain-containing protein [Phycisphaerae bacterium]|nr:polysaccharide biosynthesis C-terminal domain-containing protein [Phycisphaerae bacterium]